MNEYTKYRLELAFERVNTTKSLINSGAYSDSETIAIMKILLSCHVKKPRNNISTRSSSARLSKNFWR